MTTRETASPSHPSALDIDRMALIAGTGDFPVLIARAARQRGIRVTAVGIKDITPPAFADEADDIHWLKLGQVGGLIELLHALGISKAIMAGRVKHNSIFQLTSLDKRGLKIMASLANKKADSLLGGVTAELESEGIEVLDTTLFLRHCMPGPGLMTPEAPPGEEIERDVAFGLDLAKKIAGLDVGQTVVVKSQAVVAVEAMEGTDLTIERAGRIAGPGTVVAKVSKPRQDRRFDFPIVGLNTIGKLAEARAAALAFPAYEVLFFDQEEALALARENGIAVISVQANCENSPNRNQEGQDKQDG